MPANIKITLEHGGDDRRVSLGKGTLTTSDGEWQQGKVIGIDPELSIVEFQANRADASMRLPFSGIKSLRLNDAINLSSFESTASVRNPSARPVSIKQKCAVHFKTGAPLTGETAGFVMRDYGLFLFLIVCI